MLWHARRGSALTSSGVRAADGRVDGAGARRGGVDARATRAAQQQTTGPASPAGERRRGWEGRATDSLRRGAAHSVGRLVGGAGGAEDGGEDSHGGDIRALPCSRHACAALACSDARGVCGKAMEAFEWAAPSVAGYLAPSCRDACEVQPCSDACRGGCAGM
eukprot:1000726-Rhodomonas_salina.2